MKRIIIFYILIPMLLIIACSKSDDSQPVPNVQTGKMTKELIVNGTTREYIIYVPENYTGTSSLPLLLSFHGLTSNMEFNFNYTNFDQLAEDENFIVVHPNGISNTWTVSANDDTDINFIVALLNQLEEDYNIESNRIYSTGMSMGGFFSFSLACRLSDRIAAVASVTGSMYQPAINNCSPVKPMPILQIHGTEDGTVQYSSVAGLLDFWTSHNNTDDLPIIFNIPDSDTGDGSTVERFEYLNGDSDVEVQHLKITGGGHEWPGFQGNMDINASEEVWNFVKAFDLNGKIE
jgi:polyhydroxybutyrate depolymerase